MLSIISSLINFATSFFSKKQDVELEKYKVDGKIDLEAVKAQALLVQGFKDHWEVRASRFLLIVPASIWFALVSWDTIMALPYPELKWGTASFPTGLEYFPYAVLVFLLGNAWIKRRT